MLYNWNGVFIPNIFSNINLVTNAEPSKFMIFNYSS